MKKPIILPRILIGMCLLWIIATNFFVESLAIFPQPVKILGLVFLVPGIILLAWANILLTRYHTTHSFQDITYFVKEGPYRISRHPIYFSAVLVMLGLSIITRNPLAFLAPLIFLTVCQFYFMPYEEYRMTQTFGHVYTDYRTNVRRWI